jgi:hypothetical protein
MIRRNELNIHGIPADSVLWYYIQLHILTSKIVDVECYTLDICKTCCLVVVVKDLISE